MQLEIIRVQLDASLMRMKLLHEQRLADLGAARATCLLWGAVGQFREADFRKAQPWHAHVGGAARDSRRVLRCNFLGPYVKCGPVTRGSPAVAGVVATFRIRAAPI